MTRTGSAGRLGVRALALTVALLPAGAVASSAGAVATSSRGAWRFLSAPSLHPMRVHVRLDRGHTAAGLIFLDPFKNGDVKGPLVGQPGALIVDNHGAPVWFHPVSAKQEVADLVTQRYRGKPVLTWWQGRIALRSTVNLPAGAPEAGGRFYVYDDTYRRVATIAARGGWITDFHELLLTPRSTALMIVTRTVHRDLRPYGGSANGRLADFAVQEVSLPSGKPVFTWDMLDHVSLKESRVRAPKHGVWDPYHLNSIDENGQGDLLLSARNTWALYEVSKASGAIDWQLGGTGSTFKVSKAAFFSWQHDARYQARGRISMFDDACCNLGTAAKPAHSSRGLILALDRTANTVSVVHRYSHRHPSLSASSLGNTEVLGNGDAFVGWGHEPYYSEFTAAGRLIYDVELPSANESYRALRLGWSATPHYAPVLAVRRSGRTVRVSASWNGATALTGWRVLGGKSSSTLARLRAGSRTGFETTLSVTSGGPYFQVEALGAGGRILRRSATVRVG